MIVDIGQCGKADELLRAPADEEHRIAVLEGEAVADRFSAGLAEVLGDRAGPGAIVAEEDIAEARLSLTLRPRVHAVAESTVAAGGSRDRPHLDL